MKHNYLLLSYNSTLKKYQKYFFRLQRNIKSGNFLKLSADRKNFLLRKVEELRAKLASMQPKLAGMGAAAALAFTLTGASAQTQFVSNPAKNPFGQTIVIQNSYSWTLQTVGDLDHDGDKDIIIANGYDNGSINNGFFYFKNISTASADTFALQTGTNNPLDGVTDFRYNSPQLADMDGDGDLDIVNGGRINSTGLQLSYYVNTGTISSPAFTKQTGTDNPFPALSAYTGYASVSVVDIDADGDQDVFITDGKYGIVYFFQNTGTSTSPTFTLNTANNPFPTGDITSVGANYYLFSAFADLDGDGDQDAMFGQRSNEIIWYKNTGTATAPVMSLQSGTNNPLSGFTLQWQAPSFADLNNDGKLDMIIGGQNDTELFINRGTVTAPLFTPLNIAFNKPVFADIDGDGDKDAVFGSNNNGISYYKNNGPASAPVYVNVTGTDNPFNVVSGYTGAAPALADIDGDGDLDLMLGSLYGIFTYYQNTGTATAPIYTMQSGTSNPMDTQDVGYWSTPVFVDLDNDGDQDLVAGEYYGGLYYFMNTGTASAPVFTAQTGTNNLAGVTTYSHQPIPTFVNFDGDADMDMVVGTNYSGMLYFANTGTSSAPVFTAQTGTNNPFTMITGTSLAPAFDDIDSDGDLDLFVGLSDGTVKLYENITINVVTSVFTPVASTFSGGVAAYPNPVKDVLNFSVKDGIGSAMKVSVLNMAGSEILNQNFDNNGSVMSINVSELNNGIYLLKLSSDSKVSVVKFVKQ